MLHLDPRLAFFLACALLIGAAVPLAIAWARILPEEPAPFAPSSDERSRPPTISLRNALPVIFLALVTLSYLAQFPGLARFLHLPQLELLSPSASPDWLSLVLAGFLVLVPVLAAVYSLLRDNPIRRSLFSAGLLVFLLWLLLPPLLSALVS